MYVQNDQEWNGRALVKLLSWEITETYSHSRKIRLRIIQQKFLLRKWSLFKAEFSSLDEAQVNLPFAGKS